MKILSVKGENLLSFGKFEIEFSDSGLMLVEGWNYDDNRANGVSCLPCVPHAAFEELLDHQAMQQTYYAHAVRPYRMDN